MTDQISYLIAEALVNALSALLIADATVPATERAGLVRAGNLQDDPESHRISVLVHPEGDPDVANWCDAAVAYPEQTPYPRYLNVPAFEIGGDYGRTAWFRRGAVEFRLFFTLTGESRNEARQIAFSVLGRVERGISRSDFNITDDFGERLVLSPKSMRSRMEEKGGPDDSFIWEGWVLYQSLSERSY